ncbi:MAG: M81 family metallopeptidase [Planctomycetales bacterium]
MSHSIAVGSIFIECNHFGGAAADLETFRRSELFFGEEVLARNAGTVGGMLQTLRDGGASIRPLLVASGCPSAPVTAACYAELKGQLLQRLERALPVQGVLLALHGAAAVDEVGHLESDLLAAVRALVGEEVPVVATLDLHAHVTAQMVAAADVLLAWETYPHRDAWETGCRGARALLDILNGQLQPAMALASVPVLVSGVLGHTEGAGPFADVMRLSKSFEQRPEVYSTSAFLVHPYLDLPQMGGGGLVVTRGDLKLAQSLANDIARAYWDRRFDLEPPVYAPHEAIRLGMEIDGGPVLLVETADCCGGGAAGDSVATLRALLEAGVDQPSLVPLVDPAAAAICLQAGVGAEVSLRLGHQVDRQWGTPVPVRGRVIRLSDGRFTYRGGIWDAQPASLGPAACLQVGTVQILIATHSTYEWCGEQYDLLEMDARQSKFVVAKNPMNYRMAYGAFARGAFSLDTPGPTPATLRGRKFRRLQRPYFPADPEIPDLTPRVACGTNRMV